MSTIWESVLFEKPAEGWPEGIIASSSPFVAGPLATGLVIAVKYKTILPDGNIVSVGYSLQAIIEEEVSPGVFIPAAVQFQPINNNNTKGTQILVLQEGPVADQGVPEGISIGGTGVVLEINRTQGSIPPTYRLCIVRAITNSEKPDLDSLVVSAYRRESGGVGP